MLKKRMMMVAALVVALAVLGLAPYAFAEKVTNVKQEFSGQVLNDCNNEIVDYAGTDHLVIHVTQTKKRLNFTANESIHITGLGETTGLSYVGNGNYHMTQNYTSDSVNYPFVYTEKLKIRLVTQGSEVNEYMTFMFHMTVNANGETTAYIDSAAIECH